MPHLAPAALGPDDAGLPTRDQPAHGGLGWSRTVPLRALKRRRPHAGRLRDR